MSVLFCLEDALNPDWHALAIRTQVKQPTLLFSDNEKKGGERWYVRRINEGENYVVL